MKRPDARRLGWQLPVMALLAMSGVGWPTSQAAEPPLPAGWTALDLDRLEALRGGYALPSGLVVSFGFERQAWVNGELVAAVRVDVADVARMTPEQARALAQLRQSHVVQVGAGNAHAAAGGAGLVLQNTLDGAHIRVQTTVDAGTGALGLLQALNFGEALGRASFGQTGSP